MLNKMKNLTQDIKIGFKNKYHTLTSRVSEQCVCVYKTWEET